MKTVGIAAEYNPFHRGHACQLSACRRMLGEDAVFAAVMSGDFVQRGEAAMFSKFARAEAACRAGADLVVELPLPWSLASAEGFAAGAVSLMQALQADAVSFGAETDNPEELEELAELFCRPDFHEQVCERMKQHPNRSFPAARQALAEELLGRKLPALQQPNCILAVEYLKAIRQSGRPLRPLAVRRKGSRHDDPDASDIPSAAFLRGEIRNGRWPCAALPPEAEQVLRAEWEEGRAADDPDRQALCLLSRLRGLCAEDFRRIPDARDGAGERLYHALQTTAGWEEFLSAAASRRFPAARMRRMALCAALGLREEDSAGKPAYARVLAFNGRGRALLHELSGSCAVPLITKPAHVRKLSGKAVRDFELGARAHDLYTLFYTERSGRTGARSCGEDWRRGPALC